MNNTAIDQQLFSLATEAFKNAYAPYSNFSVAAAIYTQSGQYFSGCNVENTAYGSTLCAETTAIGQMISQSGQQLIHTVMVLSDTQEGVYPCGGCLQRLREFADISTRVVLANRDSSLKVLSFVECLPENATMGQYANPQIERV